MTAGLPDQTHQVLHTRTPETRTPEAPRRSASLQKIEGLAAVPFALPACVGSACDVYGRACDKLRRRDVRRSGPCAS